MFTRVNGVNIYYEAIGVGPPLIMLHGNGEDHTIFKEAAAVLTQRYTVYLPDTRGHGRSGRISEYHYEDMARDVFCLISVLGLKRPLLYGFSDGGIVGLTLAARYPSLLRGLVASGVNAHPEELKRRWRVLFKAVYFFKRDPLFRLMLEEPDITDEMLGSIDIPVRLTEGEHDMVKAGVAKEIAAKIPNCRVTQFRGQTHGSYIVHSTRIAEYIMKHDVSAK